MNEDLIEEVLKAAEGLLEVIKWQDPLGQVPGKVAALEQLDRAVQDLRFLRAAS